jgi:hypothetical protein
MLRSTCVATGLTGGHATNALPQTAEVGINCRILPDAVPSEIRDGIVKAFADTALEVSNAGNRNFVAPSSIGPEILGPVERVTKELFGDIPVIPTMSGATDSQPLPADRHSVVRRSGLMGVRGHSVARPGRAHANQDFFDGQEFAAADEDSLTGRSPGSALSRLIGPRPVLFHHPETPSHRRYPTATARVFSDCTYPRVSESRTNRRRSGRFRTIVRELAVVVAIIEGWCR